MRPREDITMSSHRLAGLLILVFMTIITVASPRGEAAKKEAGPRRFSLNIDPAAPIKELLPTPPKLPKAAPFLSEDLGQVPELTLGESLGAEKDTERAMAHVIAKINHLNQKDADGFLKALVADRADL